MPEELNLQYLSLLRRRWKIVLLVTILGVALAVAATELVAKKYSATTQLYVSVQNGVTASDLQQGTSFAEEQMQSYASVVGTSSVLRPAARALGISANTLAGQISTAVSTDSVIMDITASASKPADAAREANAVGRSFKAMAPGLNVSDGGGSPVKVTTVQRAEVPSTAASPKAKLNIVLGVVLGLGCGVLVALLLGLFDTRLADADAVQELVGELPILARIPLSKGSGAAPVIFDDESRDRVRAESYRLLRTALHFASVAAEREGVLVTSAVPSEGKTMTAVNLAVALGEGGQSVVLVDADLRRPTVAKYADVTGAAGLTSVLVGDAELEDAIQTRLGATGSVDILASGPVAPNPSELIATPRFDQLMDELKQRYDVVIIDSPPLTLVSDASLLASKVGGVLLVIGAERARKPDVRRALDQLATVNARVLGVALNGVRSRRRSGAYGGYYYDASDQNESPGAGSGTKPSSPVGA